MGAALGSVMGLLRQAGWAPTLVFLVHVYASCVLDAYVRYWALDIVMHVAGGVAIAYFFHAGLERLPPDVIGPRHRSAVHAAAVFALTATASVFWEFAEYASDRLFGTRAQLELEDTLLDLALGVVGGVLYVAFALRSARE